MTDTEFNKLTPHTATWGDVKRLLFRELNHGEWELTYEIPTFEETPILRNKNRPITIRTRTGSVRLHGHRVCGFNWCIFKQVRAWKRRHLFSDLSGATCEGNKQ